MSGPTGRVAGVITVANDGTYTAVPALGPFGVPATSTSLAQAWFEALYPIVLNPTTFPLATQAQVIDPTQTPPLTNKGKVLQGIAAQENARAAAFVGYDDANALINVTVPATGLEDSGGHACTGSATGTGTIT